MEIEWPVCHECCMFIRPGRPEKGQKKRNPTENNLEMRFRENTKEEVKGGGGLYEMGVI